MAKELPYFKFYINEWMSGDITLETYELQGLFISICAYYWSKDCELSLLNLNKKFRGHDLKIQELIDSNAIKLIGLNISISFLNEQLASKEVQSVTNRINGMKGGRPPKPKTEEKPNGLFFDNRNETETITETKANDNPNKTNIKESRVDNIIITRVVPTPSIDFEKFIKNFNSFSGRKFRMTKKVKSSLLLRLKDYTKSEINQAIINAHNDEFHRGNNFKYLTPDFILRPDKLEKFLNQPKQQSVSLGYTPQLSN